MFGIGNSVYVSKNNIAQPAPPFDLDSANNGLSVDPVTGKIVLGQDFAAPGNPAILTAAREIPTNGNGLSFTGTENNPGAIPSLDLAGQGQIIANVDGALNVFPLQGVTVIDCNPNYAQQGRMVLGMTGQSNGTVGFVGDDFTFLKFDRFSGQTWLTQAINDDPPNMAGFQMVGISLGTTDALFGGRAVLGSGVTPYTIDRTGGSGDIDRKIFTNGGLATVQYNLPPAIIGREYLFAIVQANTLTAQPDGTDNIIIDTTTGAASAPMTSNAIGSVITLTCLQAGTWTATSIVGTWAV